MYGIRVVDRVTRDCVGESYLPSSNPLWRSSTSLPCPTCSLLSPRLGPSTMGVDHLPHVFHMVVVDYIVFLLPHQVLVNYIHPGIDCPHVRVKRHYRCQSSFFCR